MRRLAASPVVAAVILTGILLTTISVALFFSTALIDANRQMMEYQAAKDQLTYAATALEQVAFGAGGSRYVRFSLTSAGINFIDLKMDLTISLNEEGNVVARIPLRAIAVKGGSLVTTVQRLLYPETGDLVAELGKLLVGPGEPLTIVYEEFSRGAYVYLIPQRARTIYNGAFNITEKSAEKDCDGDSLKSNLPKCRVNYFTIQVIQLEFGQVGGSGAVPVVFRNMGMEVYNYTFRDIDKVSVHARIEAQDGVRHRYSKLLSAPSANGCVVVIKVVRIEVSTG